MAIEPPSAPQGSRPGEHLLPNPMHSGHFDLRATTPFAL
jgi:hypothetical protein